MSSDNIPKIRVMMIIEVLGRPPEHLIETLNNLIEKINSEKGVKVVDKKISEPNPLQNQENLFTAFAELEIEVEEVLLITMLMFKYMPAHIDVLYPEDLQLTNHELNDILNELTRRLHGYDEVARIIQSEKAILEIKLKPDIKKEITDIAKNYNFTDIHFDTEFPFEGFRRALATTRNTKHIVYRYLFLDPATKFYTIDHTLFQKSTEILTLHERTHHQPPFNSDTLVDDYLVQKQACEEYGNPLEMMFLDILTTQFSRTPYVDDNQMINEVSDHAKKYFWIEQNEKEFAIQQLSQKENYKIKKLKRMLRDRGIIPKTKSLWDAFS